MLICACMCVSVCSMCVYMCAMLCTGEEVRGVEVSLLQLSTLPPETGSLPEPGAELETSKSSGQSLTVMA